MILSAIGTVFSVIVITDFIVFGGYIKLRMDIDEYIYNSYSNKSLLYKYNHPYIAKHPLWKTWYIQDKGVIIPFGKKYKKFKEHLKKLDNENRSLYC